MKVFLDTSVFARSADANPAMAAKREAARRLIASERLELVTNALVLAQLFTALTSTRPRERAAARRIEDEARATVAAAVPFVTGGLETRHVVYALDLLGRRQMQLWDAVLWSTAILSGCTHWASFDRPGLPHEVDGVKWFDPLAFEE